MIFEFSIATVSFLLLYGTAKQFCKKILSHPLIMIKHRSKKYTT